MQIVTGYSQEKMGDFFGLIAVQSALSDIVEATKRMPRSASRTSYASELQGAGWTLLTWDKCKPELAQELSQHLQTTVAYLWNEDTSGWFGYSVFKDGAEIEAFQFGMNYEDEMAEFAEELGEELPTYESKSEGWDVFASKDDVEFQFRSSLVKATEREAVKGYDYVSARFQGIGVPDPSTFPDEYTEIVLPESRDD